MKSCKVFLIAFVSFFCVNLNAQVFVEGYFSFRTSDSKTENETSPQHETTNYNFDISPIVGKFLSEKFAIGVGLDISLTGNNTIDSTKNTGKSLSYGISPFVRYYALKWNKFSVFGQGNIGLRFANSSSKIDDFTTPKSKYTIVYIDFYPGLSYDLNDKLSFETSFNFLKFGYSYSTSKFSTYKTTNSGFNIGGGISNIATIGNIMIGAIYKF